MARTQPPTAHMSEETRILCPFCHRQNLRRARFCQHCGRDVVLNNDGPSYYITRVIKQGGQGAVYETIGDDGVLYAVKELHDHLLDFKERDEAVGRFEAEAAVLQRLSHPRIPRVYADFKDEGRSYLAMDFVRGEDLEQRLERDGALPEALVLEWADQICDVLAYLHANGIIYRDMKPSNIMIDTENGGIKLIDFGISKMFQRADQGSQIGTPGYSPPEQYQGGAVIESDVYALGATLHHMLTGRDPRDEPPFSFPPVRSLARDVSPRTSNAVARALQKQPDQRFRSVAEMRAELRPLPAPSRQVRRAQEPAQTPARTQAPVAPVATIPEQPRPSFGRRLLRAIRTLLTMTVVLAIVLTIVGATLALAFPDVVNTYLPGFLSGPAGLSNQPALALQAAAIPISAWARSAF